jgi:glucosamine--fructose-6-phosphate aminotransferase (isomerizing)
MGGLFCATAHDDIVPVVMDGLARLERPGCDSSGVGVLAERQIQRRRVDGAVSSLDRLLSEVPIAAPTVIGYTGRATLGLPSRRNAQPHASSRVALVQVGIVENYASLRFELECDGVQFRSDTDSEVIVWLLDRELANRAHPMTALQQVLPRLRGSFALGMFCSQYGSRIYAARRGAPLMLGRSSDKAWLASDADVLRRYADESVTLDEEHIAELRPGRVRVFDAALARRASRWVRSSRSSSTMVKSGTFVTDLARTEVMAQPILLERVLRALERDLASGDVERWCGPLWRADRILLVACGDSYHAAQVAQAWLERIAGIPVELELSWELAARRAILREGVVPLVVSSSETDADALSALRYLKKREAPAVALVHGSSRAVAQEAEVVLDRKHADLGAASAVALPSQLCALAAATIAARHLRHGSGVGDGLPASIADVPRAMEAALGLDEACAEIGRRIADAGRGVFVGRGMGRPLASLGARRVEALSGLRAEGFGGGELKYRPGWRIEPNAPAVVLVADDRTVREALSDARHIIASGGEPWLIGDTRTAIMAARHDMRCITVDRLNPMWAPFVLAIPLQLIAWHAARARESRPESRPAVSEASHKSPSRRADE